MTAALASARERMTAGDFIAWAMQRPETEHYELEDGEVIAMAAERVVHARVKFALVRALQDALHRTGIEGEAIIDGPAIRIDDFTVYEPDAMLRLGMRIPGEVVEVDDPFAVFEVTSPSTSTRDATSKLANYFRLPSLAHYLIVDPRERRILHFRREADVVMRVIADGSVTLDPPGLTLTDLFADA